MSARTTVHAPFTISVVVPTLDEERALGACLTTLENQEGPFEVLVVDGGSGDRTPQIARYHGARVLRVGRGRAAQMNAGAAQAKGDLLLFLHADTRLPAGALARVRAAVGRGIAAGAFTMRFDLERPSLRLAASISDLYCRLTRDLFGDRAMFVTRSAFEAVGGFRELGLLEDLDLSVRLRRHGFRTALLPGPVVTSARRFAEVGIWRGGWWAWKLTRAFHRGLPLDPTAASFYSAGRCSGTVRTT